MTLAVDGVVVPMTCTGCGTASSVTWTTTRDLPPGQHSVSVYDTDNRGAKSVAATSDFLVL